MDDLISRQTAIDEFAGIKVDEENCTEYDIGYNDGIDFAVARLSALPSAQPVIVLCKDCRFFAQTKPTKYGYCSFLSRKLTNEDFCSFGRRQSNESV